MSNISLFGIFVEGLLSFFSPCVLPLIPLYISYLGGENKQDKKNLIINTLLFVLGIVSTFIIFGISISFIKDYITKYQEIISIIGGTIIILFALHEIGLINISFLNREFSFKNTIASTGISKLKAYLFGLAFSFAWSPCIGPMLGNALLLSVSEPQGILYLVFYALGLIIPFVITGILSDIVLNFINEKKDISKYVIKIAGVVMLCFGIYMIYNASNQIINNKTLLNEYSLNPFERTYKDSEGNEVKLKDYEDKYIYLNFIASWCTYCKQEIPYYKEFCNENDDIKCLYVMSPRVINEGDDEHIKKFIKDQNLEIQVIIDEKGELFNYLGVSSFPTTSVFVPGNTCIGVLPGMLDKAGFEDIQSQAVEAYNELSKK